MGRNLIYSIAYQILVVIVPLMTSPYLSRVLGAEKIGVYSYTYSIVFYFMIFVLLGINNYGNRSIAKVREDRDKTNKIFCSIYFLQFVLGISAIIFYAIYCAAFAKQYVAISWIQGLYIIANLFDITWYFYGKENFKATVLRNSAVKLVSLILILICVKSQDDLWIYVLIMSGSTVLGQMVMWPQVVKEIRFTKVSFDEIKVHIKPVCILFIPVLAISVFSYMDKVMLGRMSSMIETGYFENSEKIISIPKALIQAVGTVMLPRAAYLFAKGKEEEIQNNISNTMIGVMFVAFACAFGLAGVSATFAPVFWGDAFIKCGYIMALMTPALVLSVFGNVIRTQYLIPKEMDNGYTVSLVLGAIANFIVISILIKPYGAVGAAIGTMVAEFVLCAYQVWIVRKQLNIKVYILNAIPFFIIGVAMYVSVKIISNFVPVSIIGLFVEIILGAFVYILLSLVYFRLTKNDMMRKSYNNVINKMKAKIIWK